MKSPRRGTVEDPETERSLRCLDRTPLGIHSTLGLTTKARKRSETRRGRGEIRFPPESSDNETAVQDSEGSFSNGQDNLAPGDKIRHVHLGMGVVLQAPEDPFPPFSRGHHFRGASVRAYRKEKLPFPCDTLRSSRHRSTPVSPISGQLSGKLNRQGVKGGFWKSQCLC